jgi:hypothetical protein
MKALQAALRELLGLFVDDGALALAIVAVVAIAGLAAATVPRASAVAGFILLAGCLGVLLVSVMRAQKR